MVLVPCDVNEDASDDEGHGLDGGGQAMDGLDRVPVAAGY